MKTLNLIKKFCFRKNIEIFVSGKSMVSLINDGDKMPALGDVRKKVFAANDLGAFGSKDTHSYFIASK